MYFPLAAAALARNDDPATSHEAAKVKRVGLREKMAQVFEQDTLDRGLDPIITGWTGHELAEYLDAKLNSVTPRFKELLTAGKIKDSGLRRDKQIVWVRA